MTTHSSILAWENPMDRGVWKSMVHGVAKESDTIQHLNTTTNIFLKASCQLHLPAIRGFRGTVTGFPFPMGALT